MKKTLLILTLMHVILFTNAQNIDFGIKGGVNLSKLNYKVDSIKNQSVLGPVGGLYSRFALMGFFIGAEALYSQKGGESNFKYKIGINDFKSVDVVTYTYIDVPLLFGKKFGKIFRINAGPDFAFLVSAKHKHSSNDPNDTNKKTIDISSGMKTATAGLQAGIGLDLWKLNVDFRYETNLSRLGKAVAGITTDTRSSLFQITVGFNFL